MVSALANEDKFEGNSLSFVMQRSRVENIF